MLRKMFLGVVALGLGAVAVAAAPPSGGGQAVKQAVPVEKLRQVDKFTHPVPSTTGKSIVKVIIRIKTPEKSSKLGDMQGKLLQPPVQKAPR